MKRLMTVLLLAIVVAGCRRSAPFASLDQSEIDFASAEFKSKRDLALRPREAQLLYPEIRIGLTKDQIRSLLGEPDEKLSSSDAWFYTVGYSQYFSVDFTNDLVQKKSGGKTFLKEEYRSANKPSGGDGK